MAAVVRAGAEADVFFVLGSHCLGWLFLGLRRCRFVPRYRMLLGLGFVGWLP